MLNTAPQVLYAVCSLSSQILEYCSEMFLLPSCSPYSPSFSVCFHATVILWFNYQVWGRAENMEIMKEMVVYLVFVNFWRGLEEIQVHFRPHFW